MFNYTVYTPCTLMQHMNLFHKIITSLQIEVTILANITMNQLLQNPPQPYGAQVL